MITTEYHIWAYLGPDVGYKDGVDTAQLDIDLEAEVGEGLRGRLVHILCLIIKNNIIYKVSLKSLKIAVEDLQDQFYKGECKYLGSDPDPRLFGKSDPDPKQKVPNQI
jgi:hypothetical protein